MIKYSSKHGRFAVEQDGKLVCVFDFDGFPEFLTWEGTPGETLYQCPAINITAYNDGTLIITAKEDTGFRVTGNFELEYVGRYEDERIYVSRDRSGCYIYPQRTNELPFTTDPNVYNQWPQYNLKPGDKVLAGVFPSKKWSYKDYFGNTMVITYGSDGKCHPDNKYGDMPPDEVVAEWAKKFKILCIHEKGIYDLKPGKKQNPEGPYAVANPAELRRAIEMAHRQLMKFIVYVSPYYYKARTGTIEEFYDEVQTLKKKFNIDGLYIDGLDMDDPILSREIMIELRKIFPDGKLILHDSNKNTPDMIGLATTPCPAYEMYADAVERGEGIPLKQDYWNYAVNPVSNVQGMCFNIEINGKKDFEQTTEFALENDLIRRIWMGLKKDPDGRDIWNMQPFSSDLEYVERMEERKKWFEAGKEIK